MITRSEYLNTSGDDATAHRRYYGQFVTESVRRTLLACIGATEIHASTDPHFNDIALRRWDELHLPVDALALLRQADACGGTLSDKVCIFKEAARQVRGR